VESTPRRWRASILHVLGYGLLGFVIAWTFRERVLLWIAGPVADRWEASPCSKRAWIPSPPLESLSSSYLYIAMTGALLLAVPFIGRLLVTSPRTWVAVRCFPNRVCADPGRVGLTQISRSAARQTWGSVSA
jgi:hypothetical protein